MDDRDFLNQQPDVNSNGDYVDAFNDSTQNKSASYTYKAQQNTQPTTYYYNPSPINNQKVKKEKQPKAKFSAATLIICIIISIVVSSLVATGVTLTNTKGNIQNNQNSSNKNYTVKTEYNNFVEAVADACNPSVVGIAVTYQTQSFSMFGGYSVDDSSSTGSGVIYTEDGYIITNYHVIEYAVTYNGKVSVYLYENQKQPIDATVIGYNSSYDLAVLKINKKGLQPINIGSAENLKVGQPCIALGSPGGLEFMGSVNAGYISGLNRELTIDTYSMGLIQTDAAINPGNSGGALVNEKGELIGVPSIKIASTNYEGMGFAITVDDVVSICDDIIKNGGSTIQSNTPYLGVVIDTRYTESILSQLNCPNGAFVSSVAEDSPADKAGIKTGDVITALDTKTVANYDDLSAAIKSSKVGATVKVTIFRNGKYGSVSATLASSTDANNTPSSQPAFESQPNQ